MNVCRFLQLLYCVTFPNFLVPFIFVFGHIRTCLFYPYKDLGEEFWVREVEPSNETRDYIYIYTYNIKEVDQVCRHHCGVCLHTLVLLPSVGCHLSAAVFGKLFGV